MKRILIVDDEPYVREALKRVIESSSITVVSAPDGRAALDELRAGPTEMVIVDVILPGMSGVDLIRAIRQEFPKLPVIAISGGGRFALDGYLPEAISTRAYLAAAEKAGANAVLAKPFEMKELQAVLKPLLDRSVASH